MSERKKRTSSQTPKKKGRVPASVKKDIQAAVDSLPSILQHTQTNDIFTQKTAYEQRKEEKTLPTYHPPKHSGVLLWASVSLVMCTIVGLWLWNIQSVVTNIFSLPNKESQLLTSANQDLSDVLEYLETQDTFRSKLSSLEDITSSSTPTSTEQVSSSTIQSIISHILVQQSASTSTSTP